MEYQVNYKEDYKPAFYSMIHNKQTLLYLDQYICFQEDVADFKEGERVDTNREKLAAKIAELQKDGSQPEVLAKLLNYGVEQRILERKATDADTTKRALLQSQMLFVWFCQFGLCVMLIQSLFKTGQMIIVFPDNIQIVVAKFISSVVLHWICLPQIRSSLEQMKFVVNHSYRFEAPFAAFMGAVLLLSVHVAVEALNMMSLLSVMDLFEFIRDVTALIVIADFEMLMSLTLKEDCLKLLINLESFQSGCLTIKRTTSGEADETLLLKEKADPEVTAKKLKVKIESKDRTWAEYAGYKVYRVFRILFVSVWFYYLPMIVFYGQYYVPFLTNSK